MESQIWFPPASSVVGRAQKRNSGLCQHLCLGESWPPPLALMLDNSVLPCMSLVLFNILSPCWSSEGVSLSNSMHGPFKRNCQGVQQFLSFSASSPTGFYSQKLWWLIFLALEPWAGGPGVGLGILIPEIWLLVCICHIWAWDQLILCLHPSYQSRFGFFFNSIAVGLLFSTVSDIS